MRQRSGVDHPSPSSVEVKERIELYSLPRGFMACYRAKFTFSFIYLQYNEERPTGSITSCVENAF
jgi:hypothetical protein